MASTPKPQYMQFNPVGYSAYPDKRLPAAEPTNPMDLNGYVATMDINAAQNYLQTANPSYYSNSVLNSLTMNDMIFAIRHILYSGSNI